MFDAIRLSLRSRPTWLALREAQREGWVNVLRRRYFQRKILRTRPIGTGSLAPARVEVRVLTWRRDWINMIWALKSFYKFAEVDYPLYIHDGGLQPWQAEVLKAHFPDAAIVPSAEADLRIARELTSQGLSRCLAYRRLNPSTRKLFDFFAFSSADYLICIDSDIIFLRKPELLIVPPEGLEVNRYNRDASYWYSMSLDEMEANFGIRPPERINSGLAVIRRKSVDFAAIEGWLTNEKMFADRWVTEQTIHALLATLHGVEFLPDEYKVATEPGLPPNVICKHYPGFFRKHLYSEGMANLIAAGFLDSLPRNAGDA